MSDPRDPGEGPSKKQEEDDRPKSSAKDWLFRKDEEIRPEEKDEEIKPEEKDSDSEEVKAGNDLDDTEGCKCCENGAPEYFDALENLDDVAETLQQFKKEISPSVEEPESRHRIAVEVKQVTSHPELESVDPKRITLVRYLSKESVGTSRKSIWSSVSRIFKKKKVDSSVNIKKPRRKSTSSGLGLDNRVRSSVPFIGELPVPMDPGRVIDIEGEVLPDATRFSINLACGDTPAADLAFHFNPRFDQNYVARNARLSGRWGSEESISPQRNPFKRGEKFAVSILATEEEFMIAVSGIHFCSFAYRTNRIRIQTVQINGEVKVDTLDYHTTEKYPEILPNMKDPVVTVTTDHPLSESLPNEVELPLLVRLPAGINVGHYLEIVGKTKLLPHSFYVNFQNSVYMWPHPEILLHINPRFKMSRGLIMNAWLKGHWGSEEKYPLLLRPGRPFSMKIYCRKDAFRVTVDGVEVGVFQYRAAPHLVKAVHIQGDVYIKQMSIS